MKFPWTLEFERYMVTIIIIRGTYLYIITKIIQ